MKRLVKPWYFVKQNIKSNIRDFYLLERLWQRWRFHAFLSKVADYEIMYDSIPEEYSASQVTRNELFEQHWVKMQEKLPLYTAQMRTLKSNYSQLYKLKSPEFKDTLNTSESAAIINQVVSQSQHNLTAFEKFRDNFNFDFFSFRDLMKTLRLSLTVAVMAVFLVAFGFSVYVSEHNKRAVDVKVATFVEGSEGSNETLQLVQGSIGYSDKRGSTFLKKSQFLLERTFDPSYQKVFTLKAKADVTYHLGASKAIENHQYLKMYQGAEANIVFNGENFQIEIMKGNFFYYGHNGYALRFQYRDLDVKLMGTKVYFDTDNGEKNLNLFVTEGRVQVKKRNSTERGKGLSAGQKLSVPLAGQSGQQTFRNLMVQKISLKELAMLKSLRKNKNLKQAQNNPLPQEARTALRKNEQKNERKHESKLKTSIVSHKEEKNSTDKNKKPLNKKVAIISSEQVYHKLKNIVQESLISDKNLRVKLFTTAGNQISGSISKLNKDTVILYTVFGEYKAELKTISKIELL